MKIQTLIVIALSSFILYSCEDNETNYLELSESAFSNVSSDGATLTVDITSNVEWQVSKTAQWCNITPDKSFGNQALTLQIEANPDNKERKVIVTVTSAVLKMSKKIEITQAAGYTSIEQYHYKLPVIFHVLYKDKSAPEQYVSQNRLSKILDRVNKLYKNSSQSVDMNLTFTLATIRPNGETMEKPGVEYISWPDSYPIDCDIFMNDDVETGKGYVKYLWDPNEYINIIVYNFTNNPTDNVTALGISHLPYTTKGPNSLAGLTNINESHLELKNLAFPYCVSINSLFINEESTETMYNTADVTVTLAHELGHYLGLHHVFYETESETESKNGCKDTDYCTDTPTYNKEQYDIDYAYIASAEPDKFTFAYLVNRDNCLPGERFTSRNIMDYAVSYSDQFTPEQRTRIRHVLMYSPLIPGPKVGQETSTRSVPKGLIKLPIQTIK